MKFFSKVELLFYAGAFVSVFGVAAIVKMIHSEDPLPEALGPCNLDTGACYLQETPKRFNGATIQFEDGIRLNRRINTTLELPKAVQNAQAVKLVLEGRDMYLGVYEYPLRKLPDNTWQNQVVVPLCTDERMQWVLKVQMVDAMGRDQEWAYLFDIENPNEAL
ncbi:MULTISPECIES: hypothetical protein [Marinomonas]|uniref:hypothetical protein n=1 Tax=Marinomonas TaxID=28253 RepID=UPI0008371148|nr:hypothetical protein [Marinomonas atlantica]